MIRQLLIFFALIILAIGCEESNGITDETEKEQDEKFLEQLYQEILNLSESVACENSEEWEFTAIGSKACGGPTGYIAYSTTINVEDFLDQVAFYSEQQRKFNEKWGIASTCDIPAEPSGITCKEGKPVFTYPN